MAIGQFMPMITNAGEEPVDAAFLEFIGRNQTGTSYTFSGIGLGDPSPTRRIVVCLHMPVTSIQTASISIGGEVATQHIVRLPSGASNRNVAIYSKLHPSGSVADITVDLASQSARLAIGIYRITGALDGDNPSTASSGELNGQISISTPQQGVLIYAQTSNSAGGSAGLVGAEQTYSQDYGLGTNLARGGIIFPTSQGTATISALGSSRAASVAAVWS